MQYPLQIRLSLKHTNMAAASAPAPAAAAGGKKQSRWLPLEADPELMGRYMHKLGHNTQRRHTHDTTGRRAEGEKILALPPLILTLPLTLMCVATLWSGADPFAQYQFHDVYGTDADVRPRAHTQSRIALQRPTCCSSCVLCSHRVVVSRACLFVCLCCCCCFPPLHSF